jgi:hypothetical protein
MTVYTLLFTFFAGTLFAYALLEIFFNIKADMELSEDELNEPWN